MGKPVGKASGDLLIDKHGRSCSPLEFTLTTRLRFPIRFQITAVRSIEIGLPMPGFAGTITIFPLYVPLSNIVYFSASERYVLLTL